ncbi:MAG: FtsQ-type POTRA domain-containing protein [Candidatus Neomarinimicrobiota bacterium]
MTVLKKRLLAGLRSVVTGLVLLFGFGGFMALITFAFHWANATEHFRLRRIVVTGNQFLEKEELLNLVEMSQSATLTQIDPEGLQEKLEDHPYIKAARVSSNYPSTLSIDIIERKPIAYINHVPFLMVDEDGVVLPLKDGELEFDIPTLSGFNPASELYLAGERCLSRKVLETVDFLNLVTVEFPDLYGDISEVQINATDEYVLFLSQHPTRIYLGSTPSALKIRVLRQFSHIITGARTLHDYSYVDLRYEKQIVVREKA